MLEPNLVYIMLTRATCRCHVVVEDLSAGVRLPAAGVLREQGLQLGLHPRQVQPRGVSVPAGMCKKQLTWVRLTNHVRYLCRSRKWLAVPPRLCIDLQAGRPALSPVFASSVLHDQYCFESAVGEAIARGLRSGTAPGVEVLRSCRRVRLHGESMGSAVVARCGGGRATQC